MITPGVASSLTPNGPYGREPRPRGEPADAAPENVRTGIRARVRGLPWPRLHGPHPMRGQ